jgi:hypothetical protein
MEVEFRHTLKSGETVDVTATDTGNAPLAWGVTTPQSDDQALLLSRVLAEQSAIVDTAWEIIAERRREERELNIGIAGEREAV